MCEHGDTVNLNVPIPAEMSHTEEFRWDTKPVDACIAPIVQALNDARIYTSGCCCGHGERTGEIFLHDGRVLVIMSSFKAWEEHETTEDVDAYLRAQGYDPDELVERLRAKIKPHMDAYVAAHPEIARKDAP